MKKSQQKGKRTVPIRYNQDEFEKYRSGQKQSMKKQLSSNQLKHDGQQISDRQYDGSSQEYIKSSYLENEEQEEKEHEQGESYGEEDFGGEYGGQYKGSKFRHEMRSSGNPYELTFKKQVHNGNEHEFTYQQQIQGSDVNYVPSHENQNDNCLSSSSESFQQIPFQINSPKSKLPSQLLQPNSIQSLLQARKALFQKYHSALVNYHYFHSKQEKTIEEKHKEYLLELLVGQLQKNIFVNGLRWNALVGKDKRKRQQQKKASSREKQEVFESRKEYSLQKKPEVQGVLKPKEPINRNRLLNESLLDELQPKVVIFEQITYGIVKRRMFDCFSALLSRSQLLMRNNSNHELYDEEGGSYDYDEQEGNSRLDDSRQREDGQEETSGLKNYGSRPESMKRPHHKQESPYDRYQVQQSRQSQPHKKLTHQQPRNSQSRRQQSSRLQQQNSHNSFHRQSAQELSNYDQQSENYQQRDSVQQDSQLTKMRELIGYIETLKKEGRETDSQLRRYFTKWKIYMLEGILEEYHREQQYGSDQDQEREEDQGEGQQSDDIEANQEHESSLEQQYDMHTQHEHQADEPINIYHNHNHNSNHTKTPVESLTERQHSENSTNKPKGYPTSSNLKRSPSENQAYEDPTKQKKLILKSFLYEKNVNEFWDCFTEHYTSKRLIAASTKLREENLKRNVLYGLRLNIQWKEKQRAMDQYYEEIAQDQDLTEYKAAELNHRTNLKARYFFELAKTCRNLKWMKKIDKLTLKFAFYKIYMLNQAKKRKQQNIHRHLMLMRSKMLFKSFQAWKSSTILSMPYQHLKAHCAQKDNQLLEHYFSVLQILHKQSLLKHKKAASYHKSIQLNKVFNYMKFVAGESRDLKYKQRELTQYLMFSRGKQFYEAFYQFYGERILEHRLNIKAEKLWYSRQKELVYERLQEWRNYLIRKQSYRAIEYRLVKLREKQVKGKVMEVWMREFEKRMGKRDELQQSAQHKDWLVKYYGSLCEIATSGKQRERDE